MSFCKALCIVAFVEMSAAAVHFGRSELVKVFSLSSLPMWLLVNDELSEVS